MSAPVKFGKAGSRSVFKPKHQSEAISSDKPNYYYVNPLQPATGVWQGAETFVEFEIPQTVGVLAGLTLQFTAPSGTAFTASAPVSGSGGPYMPPTPWWVSRVETYIGADLIENVYSDAMWDELVNWQSLNDVDNVATLLNADQNGGFCPTDLAPSSASGNYFLPVLGTCLREAKPFVRGFNSKFRVRFYFPSSVAYTVVGSGTDARTTTNSAGTASIASVASMQLIVEEESVDAETTAQLVQAHKQGVVDYTTLVRERQVDILTNSLTLAPAQTIPLYLRSFRNRSAGITVKFTNAVPSNGDAGLKYQFATIQLLDALGRKLTEILDTDYISSTIDASQITAPLLSNLTPDPAVSPAILGYSTEYVSLLPFSSKFEKALKLGIVSGSFPFTALEQLQIVPAVSGSTLPIVVNSAPYNANTKAVITTCYSYAHITCVQGTHSFRTESGGSGQ